MPTYGKRTQADISEILPAKACSGAETQYIRAPWANAAISNLKTASNLTRAALSSTIKARERRSEDERIS